MNIALTIAAVLEYGILVLLFALSIWSIAIMIDRRRAFASEKTDGELDALREKVEAGDRVAVKAWCDANPGIHAGALKAALQQQDSEKADRAVRSYLSRERLRVEKGLPVLATLGANTPFLGLFGTVLGIIRAFAALGDSSGAASTVMSGISQALIATAAGLFVAIPAVVAFNIFSSRLRELISQSESLKDLYIAHVGSTQPSQTSGNR